MQSALAVHLIEGKTAPRYDDSGTQLTCDDVYITEQGTQSGLPLVDFKMRGPNGEHYLLVLTGRQINALSAAVKGINQRIHGKPEP